MHKTYVFLLAVVTVLVCGHVRAAGQTEIKIIRPSHGVAVPPRVLHNFSVADAEAFTVLPNRDSLLVYDTVRDKDDSADFMDSHPHIAVTSPSGSVAFDIDAVSLAPAGPIKFDGMAVVPVSGHAPLLAFAFTLGVDGAGTFFVFVGHESQTYKVLAKLTGAQAQLRFHAGLPGRFEFWTADGQFSHSPDQQCVWCSKYYKRKMYVWRDAKLVLVGELKTRQQYRPERFDEARFMVK